MDDAAWNTFATFQNRREWFAKLSEVDSIFRQAGTNLSNPTNVVAALMLVRAYSAFLGASRLAAATQVPESYALSRLTIEFSAYGLLLSLSPAHLNAWMDRSQSAHATKKAREILTWGAAWRQVEAADTSGRLTARLKQLYDHCLSFGAHPNDQSVLSNTKMQDGANGGLSFTASILASDPNAIELALKTTVQAGFLALRVWQLVYPSRFSLLLLDDRLDSLGTSGI